MSKLALRIFILYSILFTSQKILDIFLGNLASATKVILIVILWIIVFGLYWNKLTKKERRLTDKCLILLTLMLFIVSILSFFIDQIPILVIGYATLSYLSFYPLIYLIIYLKRKQIFFKKVLLFSIILYSVISIGIIYDALGGLTKIPLIGERLVALEEKNQKTSIYKYRGEQRRGSFLMESSTIVFPVLSISFLAITVLDTSSKKKKYQIFITSLITAIIVWIGCFFSLSRTPLLLVSAMIFYFFARSAYLGTTKKFLRQITFISLIVGLLIVSTQIQSYLYQQIDQSAVNAFNSGISTEDIANKKRFQAWGRGLQLFTDSEARFGYGIGTSRLGLEEYLGSKARYHYESSLLSSFSEAGILGILIEILPLLVVIYVVFKHRANKIFLVWAFLFIINLFVAPITAYSTMFSRYLGMGLCIASIIPTRQQYKQLRQIKVINYQ
jgi:hypothetical protein